ncbi:MAG: transglycosylase SLT domain-containing protein [Actinomycetota bacterium]|nr:transglycosylase SLT domain-containing protein [Actinomycetota bacterium]
MAEREAGVKPPRLVAVTAIGDAKGSLPVAAALALALAEPGRGAVICEVGDGARRRRTLVASASARGLEAELRPELAAVARGALCWLPLSPTEDDWPQGLDRCMTSSADLVVVDLCPGAWRQLFDWQNPAAAALRADLDRQRALAALAAFDMRARGLPLAVVPRTPNLVSARRALAGLEPGGELSARTARIARRLRPAVASQSGQALPLVLGLATAAVFAALLVAVLGLAATGGTRLQRAADLAAVSAARSLRDDHDRLFQPARGESGAPNPAHLSDAEYRARAVAAAREAVSRNGFDGITVEASFPQRGFAPTRVAVELVARPQVGSQAPGGEVSVTAVAEAHPVAEGASHAPSLASGGGYSGPLVYRQGEGMRPDVAAAYDRMAAAAAAAGHTLIVTSGFRSDAEQAALFQANPDPRWVAPPGTSLHRCATELDLGPPGAYGWLAANAPRFGFIKRYAWEAWHFGFDAGSAPCSAQGDSAWTGDGQASRASGSLPSYVPARFRDAIARSAARYNLPAALLAAQLLAESNFNPFAVSPAGARGIAQFMPATAAAYGLGDPFDPDASIGAQAHLMSDLLRQFGGQTALALAAYNAGPGPVLACDCVPAYPETQAYVTRILGLLGGAGQIAPPALEVRLVS